MALQQKLKSENRAPLDTDVLELIADQSEQNTPNDLNQKLIDLNKCISLLQTQDQELVLHRYWEKSNLTQYAEATGRSIGAVKVALFRVRRNLRDCLERKDRIRRGFA
jgi:RNA polymerase sigma-70 factor (ECF subfamily)